MPSMPKPVFMRVYSGTPLFFRYDRYGTLGSQIQKGPFLINKKRSLFHFAIIFYSSVGHSIAALTNFSKSCLHSVKDGKV